MEPSWAAEKKHQGQTGILPGKSALQGCYWGPLGPGEDGMQHQTGKWKWTRKTALTLCPWGGPEFGTRPCPRGTWSWLIRAREDSYLPVEQGPLLQHFLPRSLFKSPTLAQDPDADPDPKRAEPSACCPFL